MEDKTKQGKFKAFLKKFKMETEDVRKFNGPYVNPYLRLTAYAVITFLTGCVYWGWNGIQEMLYKAGAFEDLCLGQVDAEYTFIGDVRYLDCGLRKSGINNLYTITFTSHFTFFLLGGILLDVLGPKIVFMASQAVNFVSWVLIFSLPRKKWVLTMAFFFIGASTETLFTPLLTVSYYFPKNRSFVISILGSVRSLSFFIPTFLAFIFRSSFFKPTSLYLIGLMYGICGNVLCGIAGGYLLQRKFVEITMPTGTVDLMLPDRIDDAELTSSDVIHVEESNPKMGFKALMRNVGHLVSSAVKHPQLFEFLLITVSSSLFMTGISFVNKSQREIFQTSMGETVVDIYKYFNILTFLPAPFLGLVMDKFGPGVVLVILNTSGFLFYMFVSFNSYYTKLTSLIFFMAAASLCLSSIYCYLNARFDKKRFGFLLGIVFMLVGLLSLTNNPLYDFAVLKLSHLKPFNFRPVLFGLMGYMTFCTFISFVLIYISKTRTPTHLKMKNQQSLENLQAYAVSV